jgi:hypothetical protein
LQGLQSSCELFNWQTREQCQIQDFPYPAEAATGIVFQNDVPCICGGFTGFKNEKRCHRLDEPTRRWIPVGFFYLMKNFIKNYYLVIKHYGTILILII